MFGLNTYFATANVRDYMDQLFSRTQASSSPQAPHAAWASPSYDPETGTTAQDRALSKIIAILWDRDHGSEDSQPSVNENNGYILDATGTDKADTINMQAISAYNIDSGDGDDTLNIKAGSLAALNSGAGDDTLNLAADYAGAVDGGDGNDKISFSGHIADAVSGGAGNDTLKISAKTILGADGGHGDDNLYLEGERIFASGGRGDDTITIVNKGGKPAELSFAAGDGRDTINSTGALDIRFTSAMSGSAPVASGAYTPADLDIQISDNKIVIRASNSTDSLTVNFDAKALDGRQPAYSFEMNNGDYILKIR
jgi:hypothetical protein